MDARVKPAHGENKMHRVASIVPAGQWSDATAIDRVVLDADDRTRRRIVLTGEAGTQLLLEFEKPATLRDGDGLVLDDGSMVRVCGKPEPLAEIAASSPNALARLAWHLGNRHTDVQVVGERLRIRRDHVLEDMLRGLGAALSFLDAPFDPESGAYAGGQIHAHAHAHAHGHHHHNHDHRHDDDDDHGPSHRHGHTHGR